MKPQEAAKQFYDIIMLPLGRSVQAWVRDWDGTMNPARAMQVNERFFKRAGDLERVNPEVSELQGPRPDQAEFDAELRKLCEASGLLPRTWDFLGMNGGPAIGGLPEIKLADKTPPPEDAALIARIEKLGGGKVIEQGRLPTPAGEVAYTWTRVTPDTQAMILQDAGSTTRRGYVKPKNGAWQKELDFEGMPLPGMNQN